MADRYTLPPGMGGHEVAVREKDRTTGRWHVEWLVPDPAGSPTGFLIDAWLPSRLLTPVKPPLPPIEQLLYDLFRNLGCPAVVDPVDPEDCAGMAGEIVRVLRQAGWLREEAGPNLGVTRRLEDPFAEPVQLPWRGSRFAVDFTKNLPRPIRVYLLVEAGADSCDVDEARDLCRAVWAAANQADKAGEQ